jgi:hypothetical protein
VRNAQDAHLARFDLRPDRAVALPDRGRARQLSGRPGVNLSWLFDNVATNPSCNWLDWTGGVGGTNAQNVWRRRRRDSCCRAALAWGPTGHRITGAIAEHYLGPQAAGAIAEILGPESLSQAATWPDDMRSNPSEFWQSTAIRIAAHLNALFE